MQIINYRSVFVKYKNDYLQSRNKSVLLNYNIDVLKSKCGGRMRYIAKQDALKNAFLENAMTYKEICTKAQVSTSTIANVLNGKSITAKTCNKIADALSKPVTELFE